MDKRRASRSVSSWAPLFVCLLLALPLGASRALPAGGVGREARVREAMLRTYFHGVDDDLARRTLSPGDAVLLTRLLSDPDFPRRDNVVAFLAHFDEGVATAGLLSFLGSPPAGVTAPEEDRALLLAPQALGRIAARGDEAALKALLEFTDAGSDGGLLASAVAGAPDPEALRADLFEMTFRGLAFSRSPRARARLGELAAGWIRLPGGGRDLSRAARDAVRLFDEQTGRAGGATGSAGRTDATLARPAATTGSPALESGIGPMIADTQMKVHNGPLTYANHPAVTGKMDNARLDVVLAEASLRAGRSDFTGDVSCCTTVSRSGTALIFGSIGDGLDIIDTQLELGTVLNNTTARVHVVRAINYCGGTGTNIIGCAWAPGNGMSLVRMSDLGSEAVLWIHEYGHNTGLGHSIDSRAIMYGVDTGMNNGLTQSECNSYHNPAASANQTVVDVGNCGDTDLDEIHNIIDNCPATYNFTQADADGDRSGDICDPDDDNDGVADGSDCASLNGQVWATPGEADSLLLTHDASGTTLNWTAPASLGGLASSIRYDTLHSGSPSNFDTGYTCVESGGGPDTTASASAGGSPAWTAEGDQQSASYGTSVSFAGDVDNDGFDDLVIGMPRFFNGQDQEGRVLLYPGTANLTPGLPLTLETDVDFAHFGTSVGAAGDVNNDSFDDVIAGAPGYDIGSGATGLAVVYGGSAAGLDPTPAWSVAGDQPAAGFGEVVAPAGDVNNDGYDDVIVGAPFYDNGQPGEGRVFLYQGSATGPALSATWSASGGQPGAGFGAALASAGDMNHDGYDDVLIGAPRYDNGEIDEGRVYLYYGSASGLGSTPDRTFESNQASAELGSSVAGGGDINGDGWNDIVIGAPLFDNGQTDEGRVLVLAGSPAGPVATPLWTAEGEQVGAQLGSAVAIATDLNGDGLADILVGASAYDNPEVNEGGVFAYLGAPSGIMPGAVRSVEPNQGGAAMGVSVAGGGDVDNDGLSEILIGANLYDGGQSNEGRAYLFGGSRALAPAANTCFYYLVRAENACGAGPLGFRSNGTPATGGVCP